MKNRICTVAVILSVCSFLAGAAVHAQSAPEPMDNLTALYMVRASEPLCGFKMTDAQRAETLKAARFFEEKLQLSKEKAEELYNKVVASMEAQKGSGLCDANGEWSRAFKQTVENLAPSGTAESAPAANSPAPAASAPAPATPPPAGAAKLTGDAAWKAVVGNTLVGKREGKSYAEYYAPDGRIVSLEGGEIETGSWALSGESVCTNFPSEGEVCYRLEVVGETATLVDEDGSGFRSDILKGNPKNL